MSRRKISEKVLTKILIDCRRRCCLCFGLNRETQIKSGQIAHIDRNSENNDGENLAFLCLEHHDEYDSKTSQRKGLTIDEVRSFKDPLIPYTHVDAMIGSRVSAPLGLSAVEGLGSLRQLQAVA